MNSFLWSTKDSFSINRNGNKKKSVKKVPWKSSGKKVPWKIRNTISQNFFWEKFHVRGTWKKNSVKCKKFLWIKKILGKKFHEKKFCEQVRSRLVRWSLNYHNFININLMCHFAVSAIYIFCVINSNKDIKDNLAKGLNG